MTWENPKVVKAVFDQLYKKGKEGYVYLIRKDLENNTLLLAEPRYKACYLLTFNKDNTECIRISIF